MKKLLLFTLLLSTPSFAALNFEYGETVNGANDSPDGAKYIDVSNHVSGHLFDHAYGVGGWWDRSRLAGVKNSGFVYYALGLEPRFKNFYFSYFVGPSLISSTDSRLGSNFQFTHDLGIGLKDSRGVRVGLCYRHFSNAGLKEPNAGRDLIGASVTIPFKVGDTK